MDKSFKKYVKEQVYLRTGQKPDIYYEPRLNIYDRVKMVIEFLPIVIHIVNDESYWLSVIACKDTECYNYRVSPDELYNTIDYIIDKWYPGG